jgi:hypothetical protein
MAVKVSIANITHFYLKLVPATYRICVDCCSAMAVMFLCGVSACWDLFSKYMSGWFFFNLPIKCVKSEHSARRIPLGLFIRGLGCSNLMLCIYTQIPMVDVTVVL